MNRDGWLGLVWLLKRKPVRGRPSRKVASPSVSSTNWASGSGWSSLGETMDR